MRTTKKERVEIEDWRKGTYMMPRNDKWLLLAAKYVPLIGIVGGIGFAIWYAIFDPRRENFATVGMGIFVLGLLWYAFNRAH